MNDAPLSAEAERLIDLLELASADRLDDAGRAELNRLEAGNPEFAAISRTNALIGAVYHSETSETAGQLLPPAALLALARETDRMNALPNAPAAGPRSRFRTFFAGRPLTATALSLLAFLGSAALGTFAYQQTRDRVEIVGKPVPQVDEWPTDLPLRKTDLVPGEAERLKIRTDSDADYQKVSIDLKTVTGDARDLSEGQKKFAELVAQNGTRKPKVKIDGVDYDLPPPTQSKMTPTRVRHYQLNGSSFDIYDEESSVVVREISETLFNVNEFYVYPGVMFPAKPYLKTGEIQPWLPGRDLPFSPQRLTLYGCPRSAAKGDPAVKLVDKTLPEFLPTATADPASRDSYENRLKTFRNEVGYAGMWSEITETSHGKAHLGIQTSMSVKGGWGNVSASFDSSEDEERASVFMLLTQESFRVAVDQVDVAARWIDKTATAAQVASAYPNDAMMYVSEVVYGRVILVTISSSLTTSEQKIALSGEVKTLWADLSASAAQQKKNQLATTKVQVINWGGSAKPGESLTVEKFREILTPLKTSPLDASNAVPIAYKCRWLADHSPAAWVGVTPLRTHKITSNPITFDLVLERYLVRDSFDGFPNGDGELIIAANDSAKSGDGLAHAFGPHPSRGRGDYKPNAFLYTNSPVLGAVYDLKIRQGEEDRRKIRSWGDMPESDEDAFGEQNLRVNVQEVLDTKGREKKYQLDFPGTNEAHLSVRIHAPAVAEKRKEVPMKELTAGYTNVSPDGPTKKQ